MAPTNRREKDRECVKRKLFTYSPSKVDLALQAIRGGMKVTTAGRTYKVPRSTLRNKISGRAAETSGHVGPLAVLGKNVEDMLVTWVKDCSRAGFPVNKDGLLDCKKHCEYGKNQNAVHKQSSWKVMVFVVYGATSRRDQKTCRIY